MAFYVYQLVDPRNGLPFYVGKGTGRRAWQHQREVEAGIVGGTSRKVDRIREILIAGFDVEVQIIADYDSEADALDHEWRLVDAMPTLTNIAEGGGGGRTLSPAQLEKRRVIRERRLKAIREREHKIKREASLSRIQSRFDAKKYTGHEAEVDVWLRKSTLALLPKTLRRDKPGNCIVPLPDAKAHFLSTGEVLPVPRSARSRFQKWRRDLAASAPS